MDETKEEKLMITVMVLWCCESVYCVRCVCFFFDAPIWFVSGAISPFAAVRRASRHAGARWLHEIAVSSEHDSIVAVTAHLGNGDCISAACFCGRVREGGEAGRVEPQGRPRRPLVVDLSMAEVGGAPPPRPVRWCSGSAGRLPSQFGLRR